MLHFSSRLVWACMVAAIPGYVFAAESTEGVVQIDQDAAIAGNITKGDAPGFPVTISEPGSYRLYGNLTVTDPNVTAIQITADGVTLDLNGFSIIGPSLCSGPATTCPAAGKGVGIQATGGEGTGPRGVRVRNGSVRGMGMIGVWLPGEGSAVEKVLAERNAGGGFNVAGTVSDCTAMQNGSFGIDAFTVRDSTAQGNLGDGILLNGTGGVASGNVSAFNGGYGIGAPYSTVTRNTVIGNKGFGISVFCPAAILGNTIFSNEGGNIDASKTGCTQADNAMRQ